MVLIQMNLQLPLGTFLRKVTAKIEISYLWAIRTVGKLSYWNPWQRYISVLPVQQVEHLAGLELKSQNV